MSRPNFIIPENVVYDHQIPILLNTDRVSATDTFNPLFQRLIDNTHAVANQMSGIEGKITEALTGITPENIGAARAAHIHNASDISAGRITLGRLPTSATANRILRVGNANSDPTFGQVALGTDVSGRLLLANMATSATANRILRVGDANSNPVYGQVALGTDVSGRLLLANMATSATANRILRVGDANSNPVYAQVALGTDVSGRLPLANVATSATANRVLRVGNANTDPTFGQVQTADIANNAITAVLLANNLVLPGTPTTAAHTNYTSRMLRSTVLSLSAPSGGQNGDIWLRYV